MQCLAHYVRRLQYPPDVAVGEVEEAELLWHSVLTLPSQTLLEMMLNCRSLTCLKFEIVRKGRVHKSPVGRLVLHHGEGSP
jgi:hypothetical protein